MDEWSRTGQGRVFREKVGNSRSKAIDSNGAVLRPLLQPGVVMIWLVEIVDSREKSYTDFVAAFAF